jgi:hypothetical protein
MPELSDRSTQLFTQISAFSKPKKGHPMSFLFTIYFALAACALVALSIMIFKIGDALSDCPVTGRAAKAGSLTIVTGFMAIGAGGVLIFAARELAALREMDIQGVMAALGISLLCLGLGFSHAVATLRDVVAQSAIQAKA